MNTLSASNGVLFFIFLLLVSTVAWLGSTISYAIFSVFIVFLLICVLVGVKFQARFIWFDIIPAIFIAAWIYGICVGFVLGNNASYVISNFAGMSLYSIYFIMVFSKINEERLVKVVLSAAVANAIYSYGFTFWLLIVEGRSYVELLRVYYSPGLSVLGPFLASSFVAIGLLRSCNGSSKIKDAALLVFFLVPYGVLSFSKGYFASAIMLFAFVLLVLFVCTVRSLKVTHAGLFLMLSLILSSALVMYNFADEFLFLYSVEEAGNSIRNQQKDYLIEDLSFFGNGLGAVLDSGYSRNDAKPYGFELTYLNILHKLGSIGALVWLAYAVCIAIPLANILSRKEWRFSWLAIGGMLFLVPGYGNPLLFGPTIVTLHCVVMYWIRNVILKTK